MFAPYRRVLAIPGASRFCGTALVARLPISMAGLGIVLLVQASTGSYAVAGSVSATYLVANAVVAIVQGRSIDRFGQGVVLGVLASLFGVAVAALVTSVQVGWPGLITYVAAAMAGSTLPPIGSCVRARWTHVLNGSHEVQTAYALESVVDEAVFILGPILVTVLATVVHPILGLLTAGVAGCLGGLAFAAQRSTEPPAHTAASAAGPRSPMPWRIVAPLVVVCAALGVLFGAAEVTTVAFAGEHGNKAYSGALLALWALGSLVSGLVTGAVAWHRGPSFRVRLGALAMSAAMAPLALANSIPLLGLLLLVGGVAIAPTMIATLSLVQEVVPAPRLTEGMAYVQTGLIAGVAPGAAVSGVVIDHFGASPAYLVSLGAGLLAALASLTIPRRLDDRAPVAAPTVVLSGNGSSA